MTERLAPRPWMAAPSTRAVISALEVAGGAGCARFVGGCVRDALLGVKRPWSHDALDIDIATTLLPPAVVAALEAAGLRAVPTGLAHGTVTAVAEGRPFEITTLRRDVETDGRHAVVAFTDDWAQDAARRDFRLNALYADPDGRLHDPTGEGVSDARAGRIIFVGAPDDRIAEDYLRILRFFRFYAGYGRGGPDAAALEACARLKGGLDRLSGERVAAEFLKLLAVHDPWPAVRAMAGAGVLQASLPGAGLARFEGLATVERATASPPDALLRLAALLPDDRAAVIAAAQRLRLSNAQRARLLAACASPDVEIAAATPPPAVRRAVYAVGAPAVADRVRLAWAAEPAADAGAWREVLEAGAWSPPPFPVTGEDIKAAGVPEGPAVGRVRAEVAQWWIAHDFPDDRPAALARLGEAAREVASG